jgi:cytoskeletal protein CcmA (bactofilin family)
VTHIGNRITIEGEVESSEELRISGTVKGRVNSAAGLFIEQQGFVDGDIKARDVDVAGRVNGNIEASGRVEISLGDG